MTERNRSIWPRYVLREQYGQVYNSTVLYYVRFKMTVLRRKAYKREVDRLQNGNFRSFGERIAVDNDSMQVQARSEKRY